MKKIIFTLAAAIAAFSCKSTKEGANETFAKFDGIFGASLYKGTDVAELEAQYKAAQEEWDAAIAFLKRTDLADIELGKHELTANGTYANVTEYNTTPETSGKFEAHRIFVDIQYTIKGEEMIYLCGLEDGRETRMEYNQEKDCELFNVSLKSQEFRMTPENYTILFPKDGHMPGRPTPEGPCYVKKVIVKIPYVKTK